MNIDGVMTRMELMGDDGESEHLTFTHGPDCQCGSQINMYREHWEALGRPTLIMVNIFPDRERATISGVVEGPWNQL